jgi:hypothetical protein
LLQQGWLNENPWQLLAAMLAIVLIAAVAMWHLVEKRFLFSASHYVKVTGPRQPSKPTDIKRCLAAENFRYYLSYIYPFYRESTLSAKTKGDCYGCYARFFWQGGCGYWWNQWY